MYALVMEGCNSVDIAEDTDTLLAQYKDNEAIAVDKYGIYYQVYIKEGGDFIPTNDYILTAIMR